MAITLELLAPTGLTLTVDVYPYGSDTRANGSGDALVEATNRKGLYTATIAEAITGWHTAHVLLSGTVIVVGDVYLVAGETCRVRDHDPRLSDEIAALEVWPAAAGIAPPTAGTITIRRGDTLSVSITGLGDISSRTKLWITGKGDRGHPDTAAVFLIEETAGLLYLAGAVAATPTNAELVVTDESAGDLTLMIKGVETAKLAELVSGGYDIQVLETAGPRTLSDGELNVTLDVTRATS